MPAIHLFGGEKGGVGKSFVCRTAIAYHLEKNIEFVAFDADRSNPDVMRIYGPVTGCEGAVFSEGEKYEDTANSIFNAAMGKRVLVNLPAQSLIPLKAWIEKNELFDLAADSGVEFVSWFVSDCGYDSLKLFGQSLDFFGDHARHVFVANYGMTEDWESLKKDKALIQRLRAPNVAVLKFPKLLGNYGRNQIDALCLTFEAAAEHDDFDAIPRQRIKSFLRNAFEQFDEVGVFDGKSK
jgi:hypothetical protein